MHATVLACAALWGRVECVAALLAAGAEVEGAEWGPTTLSLAAAGGHAAVMARLLAAGARCGRRPLRNLERALLGVWQAAPSRLPDLAQHLEREVLARVGTALAALRLRTPQRQPELYARVVALAFQ